jgi:hypothetical protein
MCFSQVILIALIKKKCASHMFKEHMSLLYVDYFSPMPIILFLSVGGGYRFPTTPPDHYMVEGV